MARRDVAIEIFVPGQEGLEKRLGESMINATATPNVQGCNYYYGALQKAYGTTLFHTGSGGVSSTLGSPITFMYKALFPAESVLEAFTDTGMHKYSSGLDAFVVDGQTYSGTYTDVWSACIHNNELIYTNRIELLQRKAAYDSTGTVMSGVATDSYKAGVVLSFANHLNIYNTVEGGTDSRKRIRWTKVGALVGSQTDWDSGTAGFVDLLDVEGDIMTAGKLGNSAVAIYGENSVHLQYWVGGGAVYNFSKMVTNKGTPSKRGVIADGTVHYMIGRDNIYEYRGGTEIKSIADAIAPEYTTVINNSAMNTAFMEFNREDRELLVHVPTDGATQPNTVYICKVAENYHWYKKSEPYTSVGEFDRPSGVTIDELQGTIDAQNWRFDDMLVQAGGPTYLVGDLSGRVAKRDKTVYSISESGTSTPQTFVFDTKDLSSINDLDPLLKSRQAKVERSMYMDRQSRWLQFKVEAKGAGSMYMHYSTDAGQSFTPFNVPSQVINATWNVYTFDLDVARENIMCRISNSALNEVVHVRYLKAQFVPGSEVQQ